MQELSQLLAHTYTLCTKTHSHHWNVTGPMFTTLHTLVETQYTEYALAVEGSPSSSVQSADVHGKNAWMPQSHLE